jgi:glycerol-3-phosphate dehydrogenase
MWSGPVLTVIAGGKYTTYRVMAKDAVDSAVHGLERTVPCAERIPLAGADRLLRCLQLPHRHRGHHQIATAGRSEQD